MLAHTVPEFADLELLAVVAQHGSMTAAAAQLGLTQQAVSLRIRSMERLVGLPLLLRSRNGSELTSAGRLLNQWASSVLTEAEQLAIALASLRTDRDAHLRIAASLTVAEHLLPGWLVALHDRQDRAGQPATSVELSAINTDAVISRLRSGDADLGFIEGPYQPAGLHARTVATDELLIVVRPDHPWARRRRPVPVELLAATALIGREPGSGTRQAFDDAMSVAMGENRVRPAPALEVSTPAAVRAALSAGVAPAAISALAVADDLALGRLRSVPVTGIDLRRTLRAVWSGQSRPPVGPARLLLDLAVPQSTTQGQRRRPERDPAV
jgi:molybdate transport repressor ModE-like protein